MFDGPSFNANASGTCYEIDSLTDGCICWAVESGSAGENGNGPEVNGNEPEGSGNGIVGKGNESFLGPSHGCK